MQRFFRSIYEDNADRRPDDRRSVSRDVVRYIANRFAQPFDRILARRYRDPSVPVVFIVGAPRSGTTLLHQIMCAHLDVGYVSNAMARWWMAPVAAARFGSTLGAASHDAALASDLGRSEGPSAPHEFGWFWEFHLWHEETDDLDAASLARRDFDTAKSEIEGLAGYFNRPLVFKALMHVPYKIAWLKAKLPQARFIWIHRDPIFVAQSILQARHDRFGDTTRWWSVRPRDVAVWKSRSPYEQVAHQILDVTEAMKKAFGSLGPSAGLHVEYDDLVSQPQSELRQIANFCGAEIRTDTALATLKLATRNQVRLSPDAHQELARALESASA